MKHLNFLRSDWEIKKSASHEIPWCFLLWRDLCCSLGLVIKPDHLWGTKSYLHIWKVPRSASKAGTDTDSYNTILWIRKAGGASTTAQFAGRCHALCSALLVPCSMNLGRATSKICWHLSPRTTTYQQTPRNLLSVPCSQSTHWTETHTTSYGHSA